MYNQENNKDMFETFMFRQNCNKIKMGESKFYTRTYNTKCIVKCEIIVLYSPYRSLAPTAAKANRKP